MTPRKITILNIRINCIDFCNGCAGLIDMKKSLDPARSLAMSEDANVLYQEERLKKYAEAIRLLEEDD